MTRYLLVGENKNIIIYIINIIVMESKTDKDKPIHDSYYDLAGFTNLKDHFKSAHDKDKSITIEDVKNWRKLHVEPKKNMRGYNSFVASKPREEYQMDLAFFDMADEHYIGALFMIDIFTKYAVGVPFKTKQPHEILECIKEGIKQMGGKPETFYSDPEGAFLSNDVQKYFKDNHIRHLTTVTHAPYVERLIRTIKNYVYARADYYKKPWYTFLWPSMLVYNNKAHHSVIGMTPNEATKKQNEFEVKINLLLHKKHNRDYPELKVGDSVKVYRKKDLKHKKERFSVWSANKYKIDEITNDDHGQPFYKIRGMTKPYMRHELLKITE